jgi:hypothetical protein
MNSNNSTASIPELVEPIKILHVKQKDSFFAVHHDFLVVIVIFIVLITIVTSVHKHLQKKKTLTTT